MKINHLLLSPLFALLTLQACQPDSRRNSENDTAKVNTEKETPPKLIDVLVGEWRRDTSAPSQRNGQENEVERMVFTQEARYIQYSGDQKIDSGAYRMNEQLRNLYLESEANGQPREFEVELQQNRMTLKPKSDNQAANRAGDQTQTYRKISSNRSPSN